jgi:hypothetical protein
MSKKSNKTLLKRTKVSDEHFSSGRHKGDGPTGTRCVVHIMEAKSLLASDAETGKSDPVCFLSIGPSSVIPQWDTPNPAEHGILITPVKPASVNPIWNVKLTFPLVVEGAADLMNAYVHILIRDEDVNEDGSTSYDNLGEVSCASLNMPGRPRLILNLDSFQLTIASLSLNAQSLLSPFLL